MPIDYVQPVVSTSSADVNTKAASFATLPTVGNFIVVCVAVSHFFNTGDINTSGVTDNQGNTYTRDNISTHPGAWIAAIFSAQVETSSGTFTITVNGVNSDDGLWFVASEYSGIETSGALDQTAASNGSGNPHQTGALVGATAQQDELEVVFIYNNNATSGAITVDTVTPAYTSIGQQITTANGSNSSNPAGDCSYRILTSITSDGASWTVGSNFDYSAVACTYKQAGAPPAPSVGNRLTMAGSKTLAMNGNTIVLMGGAAPVTYVDSPEMFLMF